VKLYWGEANAQGDVRFVAKNQLLLRYRALAFRKQKEVGTRR
jgi:hypothetical protein